MNAALRPKLFTLIACLVSVYPGINFVSAASPLHQRIDKEIESRAGGNVAESADDAEFLRRVTG